MDSNTRELVKEELERISRLKGGRITPDTVIVEAKKKSSPLHEFFTWDDSEAAKKQRLYEARELIRSVRVTTVVEERVFRSIAYVRDPGCNSDQQGYIATSVLRTNSDMARDVLIEEFGRAAAAMRRALDVADALSMKEEVQQFVDGIVSMKSRVEVRAD
jgi:hypothetical protein